MAASKKSKKVSLPQEVQKSVDSGNLMVSVSGIRGTLPGGFSSASLARFVQSFAAMTGKSIVLGNDARPSGEALRSIIQGSLLLSGKEIIDTGLAPTPTVKAVVSARKASAGIIVTASHNPIQWNGLKFLKKGGLFFGASELESWKRALLEATDSTAAPKKMGTIKTIDGVSLHIESILKRIPNVAQIRKQKYRVVVDGVNGAGREALPLLLEALGCKVIRLNCESTLDFPRPPEPTPSALKEFSKLCIKEKVAAGFALDPDADRLVPGTAISGAINEEYTLPLALMGYIQTVGAGKKKATGKGRRKGVVVNLSSSLLTEIVALEAGLPF
ncbi:MAG: phosphoglucosamine mutase, partial [Leptospiraceae bacterium]|nr:phosphoglucosamine mutase [Leptospiraceae bacterium]